MAKARKGKPAARGKFSKQQANFIHKVHTGKHSKREMAEASPNRPRALKTLNVVEYDWTDDRDNALRERFAQTPRTAVKLCAAAFGFPFHIVKQRAKFIGLLPAKRGKDTVAIPTPAPLEPSADASREPTSPSDGLSNPRPQLRHAKCGKCKSRATWDPNDSADQQRALGLTRGFTEDGLPICPHCRGRVPMLESKLVDAPTAVKQVLSAIAADQSELFTDLFNADGAYRVLEELDDEIEALQDDVDEKKRVYQKANKALQTKERQRLAASREFKRRRQQHALAARAREDRADVKADAVCIFERDTGKECRVCRGVSVSLAVATTTAVVTAFSDRDSAAHRAAAIVANSSRTVEQLGDVSHGPTVARALAVGGLHGISADDIETWSPEQRLEALRWVDAGADRVSCPEVLGLPHVAGEPGTQFQACVECGAHLVTLGDHIVTFPVGAAVGLHCTGPEVTESAAPAAAAAHA